MLEAALDLPKVLLKRFRPAGDVFDTQAPTKQFAVSYRPLALLVSQATPRAMGVACETIALRPVTMVMEVKRRSALYIGMGRNSLKTEPTVQAFYQPTLLQLYLSVYSEPVGLPTIVETLPGCCYRRSTGRLFRRFKSAASVSFE